MPSIFTSPNYEAVEFLAARPFIFNGTTYNLGDLVPDAKSWAQLEVLVRSRRLVPVVDDYSADAPLQFRREVKTRELALRKMGLTEQNELPALETPENTEHDAAPFTAQDNEYDPGAHNVGEVLDYVDEYPDELLSVYALEEQGKARPRLLKQLDDRLNKQVEEGNSYV